MALTIDFKKVGGLALIHATADGFQPAKKKLVNKAAEAIDWTIHADNKLTLEFDGGVYGPVAASAMTFEGTPATDLDDFLTKIALVFPELGGGSTTTPVLTSEPLEDPATYELEAGTVLESLVLFPGGDATIKIGTSAGNDDLFASQDVTEDDGAIAVVNLFSATNNKTVYFTNLPAGTLVVLFLKATS